MVHIAGTRMIEEGADGLSRGFLSEGVMRGVKISEFIPLHLTAFERSPALEPWLRNWAETGHVEHQFDILKPEGWFEQGHDIVGGAKNIDQVWMPKYKSGNYILAPPPAAADVCIDELRNARHKRQESTPSVCLSKNRGPKLAPSNASFCRRNFVHTPWTSRLASQHA